MITIRSNSARGHCDQGWIRSFYTFSFHTFIDPFYMGYRSIRAINEDRLSPHQGSALHTHRDVEILTFVLEGELTLESLTGPPIVLTAGQLHLLSAGTGILHKEINQWKEKRPVRSLQIWFIPDHYGLLPQESILTIEDPSRQNSGDLSQAMRLIASRDAKEGSLQIHQDVNVWYGRLQKDQLLEHPLPQERYSWLQVLSGSMVLNTHFAAAAGDGASLTAENELCVLPKEECSFFFFDLG